ncbi:MAG TPA: tetratricopeptide repeat protein [Candidatus Polarisedimenticolia bacterium]|nr:tetratricopeptide repeat protein [Candidatus Polarisedimenticolia bacterium]
MTLADTVHLKDGRILRLDSCTRVGEELQCRRAGGLVGISMEQVDRVDASPAAPSGARGQAGALKASSPKATPGPAKEPLTVEYELAMLPGVDLNAATAQARIDELAARVGSGARRGTDDTAVRREISVLHTYLGNLAMQRRDYEEGEASYSRALGYDPGLLIARLNRSTALINLTRYEEAESELRPLLSEQPDNARALELAGEVAFQTGHLEDAIDLWEKSLALRDKEGLRARLEKVKRLGAAEQGFLSSTAAHFTLKFDGEEATEELARQILSHLEEAYAELSTRFAHFPGAVIQVTLYPKQTFHDVTESPAWVGGLYDGQMRIPIGGLTHLTPQARRVLTHELTHSFISTKTRGAAPQWIQEGMAQVAEGKTTGARRAQIAQECAAVGEQACWRDFSYPKALSQVEFFLDTWSQSQLNDLLEQLGKGAAFDAAMRTAIGQSEAEFKSAWIRWLSP